MKTLEEAQADLDAFLMEHPELQGYQDKLDADMKDMTPIERMDHIVQCTTGLTFSLDAMLRNLKTN
jgi:hypothetical protein